MGNNSALYRNFSGAGTMRDTQNRSSIRYTFLRYIVITLLLCTVALSSLIAVNEGRMLRKSLESKGRSLASYIALISQDPLVMKESIQLDSIVSEVNKDEDILFTVIHDAKGAVVTSQFSSINYQSPAIKETLAELPKKVELSEVLAAVRQRQDITVLTIPILTGDYTIGTVTIGLSQRNIQRQIATTVQYVFMLNALVVLVLGVILFIVSKRVIFSPLTQLVDATTRLAGGDLATRIGIDATGEVKTLIEAFNLMAEDLNRSTVSREYVDSIIGSMLNALIVVTPDTTIVRANAAACELLGYPEGELVGLPIGRIFVGSGEPNDASWLETMREQLHVSAREERYRSRDGREIPVLLSASVIPGDEGAIRGYVYVAQDITKRKQTEEALLVTMDELLATNLKLEEAVDHANEMARRAESASLAKSQFLANMSHELRTPMNGVLGMIQLAQSGALEAEQQEYLDLAYRSGCALVQILNDILDLTRIEKQKLALLSEPFSLRKCVSDTISLLRPEATRKGLHLITLVADDVPETVAADQVRLQQVLTNLVGNAVKFTEQGTVTVRVTMDPLGVTFMVTDTGIGIPSDKQDLLFQPFSQVDASDTRRFGGIGLGLAISKEIVELMGGTMTLESAEGQGSTFSCTLPLVTAAPHLSVATHPVTLPAETALVTPLRKGETPRILIVEDDPASRAVLYHALKRRHYVAETANNGLQAVGKWEKGAFDLIIMDVQMPVLDGIAAARVIREKERVRGGHIPILAMTAHAFHDDEARCLDSGMDAYLSKPVNITEAIEVLSKLVGKP
jgi:PAS domain S-box-containing protein